MGKKLEQRERILVVEKILLEETDERHPIRLEDLINRLARMGLPTERKTLYRDIKALRSHGVAVAYRGGADGGWFVEDRALDAGDLRLLMDALAVYRWLPEDQRAGLMDKLARLAPQPQRKGLERPVAVCRRAAAEEDGVRLALDRIHACLQGGKAMSFLPVDYDENGARAAAGEARKVVSPKGLLWTGENYRLLAWDHRGQNLALFRPDRMEDVLVTGMPAQGPAADPSLWAALPFGPAPDRRERVRLRCRQEAAGEVLDRLGRDTRLAPEGDGFVVTADVAMTPAFWGWAAAQEGRVEVTAPPWAAKVWQERYRTCLRPQAV